jgi:hypothetical protein
MEYEIVDEPPPRRAGQGVPWTREFAEFLRAHPGKWVIAPRSYPSVGAANSQATYLKRLGLEATCRKDPETGECRIYARWTEDDEW